MFSGVAVALPAMGADLGAGATALGLVETLFLAGSVAFLLPVGRLASAGDKRALYKLGLAGFGVSAVGIGVSSSVPLILLIRFLQGLTSAILATTGPALLAELVPAERRGRAYGGAIGSIYAGLTAGPICAGLMVDAWGWRAVFLIGGAILLVGAALVHLILPSSWRLPLGSMHLVSALLVVLSVLLVVLGSALLGQSGPAAVMLLAGIVLAIVFVVLQRRLERPLLNIDALMSHRVLRNALLVQMLLYMNAYCSTFLMSIYMQVSLGHPARTSGMVLAIGTLLMALTAPLAGAVADRLPAQHIASCGVACAFGAALLALGLDQGSSLARVTLVLALQGFGFAMFSSPNMTIVMGSVPPKDLSMASALSAKSRSLGMVSGMIVTALLISNAIGNDPISSHPAVLVEILRTAFSILAFLAATALVVSLATSIRRRSEPADRSSDA